MYDRNATKDLSGQECRILDLPACQQAFRRLVMPVDPRYSSPGRVASADAQASRPNPQVHLRMLGMSRYLIGIAVAGTFNAATTLLIYGAADTCWLVSQLAWARDKASMRKCKSERGVSRPYLLAFVIAVGVLAYVVAGPFIVSSGIKNAIAEGDSERLSELIDFAVLRQNLKDQINAIMMQAADTQEKDDGMIGLLMAFSTVMVDQVVDTTVTPASLGLAMAGERPDTEPGGEPTKAPPKNELFKNARYIFDSTTKFSIWVPIEREDEEIRFVFTRAGLSWQLTNMILPIPPLEDA
jgi:hypothetical protein